MTRGLIRLFAAASLSLAAGCGVLVAPGALAATGAASTPVAGLTPSATALPPGWTGVGALVVIPGSSGATASTDVVKAVKGLGAGYIRVSLDWATSEPSPGGLSFDTANDRKIRLIEQAGLRVFPTLYVGRGWMNQGARSPIGSASRSGPPTDLSKVWSEDYGFSRSYYDFVYAFFRHYRGHFDHVAIENEASSKLFWGGTADEYLRLLRTAYKAIKAADPQVRVADSGLVSNLWGLCIADDDLRSGILPKERIVQFAVDYYSAPTGRIRVRSESDLSRLLGMAQTRQQCQQAREILAGMAGSVDDVNFHFYEDYRVMPHVVEWIRDFAQSAGYAPGVLTNEMGQRGADVGFANSEDHARAVFKKLITGWSLGLEDIIWFSADTIGTNAPSPDKVGLLGTAGEIRPAARTFRLVVGTANGYRLKASLATGPSLFHHVFEDAGGVPGLEALWTEGGPQTLSLSAPNDRTQAVVTDYAGEVQSYAAADGVVQLTISDDPVFVEWK
jgi:hypothetical protein